jgi:hypothetical protein
MPALRATSSGPPRCLPSAFGSCLPLGLARAAIDVILARHSGKHVEHHCVDSDEHPAGEFVTWRGKLPRYLQIERHDTNLSGVDLGAQLPPVSTRQAR